MPKLPELRTPEGIRVRVQLFPGDAGLARDVARAWASLVADRVDDETFRNDLEEHLRRWYPRVSLHGQTDLASLTQEEEVWYLFRDGRVRRESPIRDRFYGVMSAARSTTEESSVTLRNAEVVAKGFAERRTARKVGAQAGEPTARPSATTAP